MGKGHRLLKKVKSEKNKVKIKGSSKHLPKGTNVTDTSFKVKQIVIREQLKVADASEPLSKRKLSIKELLTRLQHYNSTVRTDAINGLKEIVTASPEKTVESLSQLLQGIAPAVLDKEKTVRREALRLIAMILSPISTEKLRPFFDVLSSYLRCAMTHIDVNIQEDSLLLLDNLLASVPHLVALNSGKILPNFFDLISRLKSDSAPGRTLTVSLGNKITGIKWRVKVLNRLYGMLDAIILDKTQKDASNRNDLFVKNFTLDAEHNGYVPLYLYDYLEPVPFSLYDTNNISNATNDIDMINYVDVIVPLLFETWLEVGPGTKAEEENIDSTLNEEASTVLNCALNILLLLWKLVQLYDKQDSKKQLVNNFIKNYSKDFTNYILKLFPYSQSVARKRKRSEVGKELVIDKGCTTENLIICYLFCVFNKKITNKTQIANVKKIARYVQDCVAHKTYSSSSKQLFLALKTLLVDMSVSWHEANLDFSRILGSTIEYYQNTKLSENSKHELFNILTEVVHLPHLNKEPNYQIWLSTLPDILLKPEIFEKNIDILRLLAKQNNPLFTNALLKKYSEILNNIPILSIINCENKYPVISKIVGLLFWMPVYDKENLEILKTFLETVTDEQIRRSFINLLTTRYHLKKEPAVLDYLNMVK